MFTKVVALFVFVVAVQAGNEAPPPKVHTYNVPSVAKVSYPGPTVTKSVETYSAPSIEKTTTITRTITAPLNAPAGKQVAYAAPSPLIKAAPAAVYAAPAGPIAYAGHGQVAYAQGPIPYAHAQQAIAAPIGYAGPGPLAYAQPALAAAPVAYAPAAYAAGVGAVSAPGLALNSAPLGNGAFSNQFGSLYAAPSLGYALQGQFLAAAPAQAVAAAPAHIGKGY